MNAATTFSFSMISASILATVVAAHALVGGAAGSAMQHTAAAAMQPLHIVRAEPMVIRGHKLAVLKAERITIVGTAGVQNLALNSLPAGVISVLTV